MDKQKLKRRSMQVTRLDKIEFVAICIVYVMVIMLFGITVKVVDGQSMESTLHDNELLVVSTFCYTPKQGDVVILNTKQEGDMVKRVVALSGQTVQIYNGNVLVDKKYTEEPYLKERTSLQQGYLQAKVEKGTVYVMGDNRETSIDSRELGNIPYEDIVGRVLFRLPSFKSNDNSSSDSTISSDSAKVE